MRLIFAYASALVAAHGRGARRPRARRENRARRRRLAIIDADEFALQRHGYASAIADPRVIDAILPAGTARLR